MNHLQMGKVASKSTITNGPKTLMQCFAATGIVPTPPGYGKALEISREILESLFPRGNQNDENKLTEHKIADENARVRANYDTLKSACEKAIQSVMIKNQAGGMGSDLRDVIEKIV